MSKQTTFAIVGAGSRGLLSYGSVIEKIPEIAKVIAVAEPRKWFQNEAKIRHKIHSDNIFNDWRELAEKPKIADAVIVATQDNEHTEPALAFIKKGYNVLLEKPMATNEEDCIKIVAAAKNKNIILAVCHVLRYSSYFRQMKKLVDSGCLGQIVTVRHIEQVGFWHHAHSYVRGNWRSTKQSSPMILAKSCHDFDILLYLLGKMCSNLSSIGSLAHFHNGNKPKDAANRCLDCKYAFSGCAYSSIKFYKSLLDSKKHTWPLNVVVQDFNEINLEQNLRNGPYGKCVYDCDNDVVDNQVVTMEFEGPISVSFTMNAFTAEEHRKTEIYGSNGELHGDGKSIYVNNFLDGSKLEFKDIYNASGVDGGHMGGDKEIIMDFIKAVSNNDASYLTSGPEISLQSHLMAFAAERSRLEKKIITL